MITRVGFKPKDLSFKLEADKSNIKELIVADVAQGRSFLQNDGGYPMNDIDFIIRQQDANVRESLIAQLQEVPTSGVPYDTPPEKVLQSLRSRYQQSPAEVISWLEKQIEINELDKINAQDAQKENIQFDKSDAASVVDNV